MKRLATEVVPSMKIMKILTRFSLLGSMLLVPLLARAAGCVDSPECPTAILGVVGAAGAVLYVRLRSR
ncbi:MAG TPA: PExPT-CTERM protein [Acidobacteriaceae bacterium]